MPATVSKNTGQMIKQARLKKKMSQEELSKRIEQEVGRPISHTQISKWETGLLVPRLDMMKALNKILGLFGDEIKEASKPHVVRCIAPKPMTGRPDDEQADSDPIAAANQKPATEKKQSAREILLGFARAFESHEDAAIKSMDGIKHEFGSVIFHFNPDMLKLTGMLSQTDDPEPDITAFRRIFNCIRKKIYQNLIDSCFISQQPLMLDILDFHMKFL